ncbi:MAG: acetylxylan esterase [Odoribacter sp.]|nr:acetylxylan esterase [Odoribacter sp.]
MKKVIIIIVLYFSCFALYAQYNPYWNSEACLLKDTVFRKPIEPEEGAAELKLLSEKYQNIEGWKERRECLKNALQMALLLPDNWDRMMPPFIICTEEIEKESYSVFNLAIQIIPGLWATGNLYFPLIEENKKCPLILSAQGHGAAEPSEKCARFSHSSQVLCASLAQMGAIVFNYDMFGIGESGFHMGNNIHRTGLSQCIQTFTTMRLIDYFESLFEVDASRIGMTGASGGGMQTFLAAALDERISVAVPVVQVSCFFPGGCPCESGRPIHVLCDPISNNAEITALIAPRPLLIVSDGKDWTRTVDKVEFPFIQCIYGFYDKKEYVENVHLADEGHDYGPNKRYAMYEFMSKHLGLNLKAIKDNVGNYKESEENILPWEKLMVFPDKELPSGYLNNPQDLCKRFTSLTQSSLHFRVGD